MGNVRTGNRGNFLNFQLNDISKRRSELGKEENL